MRKESHDEKLGAEQNDPFFDTKDYQLMKGEIAESVKEIMSPALPYPTQKEKDKIHEFGPEIRSGIEEDMEPLVAASLDAMEKAGVDPGKRSKIFWEIVADNLEGFFDKIAEDEIYHPLAVGWIRRTEEADTTIDKEILKIIKRLSPTIFHQGQDLKNSAHAILKSRFYSRISLKPKKGGHGGGGGTADSSGGHGVGRKDDKEGEPPGDEAMAH